MNGELMYSMEELVPIVSKLTQKYTSNENSSITYETAQMLMEAVIYCIQTALGQSDAAIVSSEREDPHIIYLTGYELVLEKTKRALQRFNHLNQIFCDYGNCFLRSALNEMAVFFSHYDARFSPQDHIVFLDYPIRLKQDGLCGINYIEHYLECLIEEQLYLKKYPRNQIEQILYQYDRDYGQMPVNIYEIVQAEIE